MPDTTPDQAKSGQHRRDTHDKATLVILVFTLIATGCAACFTGWQAWIARDQEHRTLRAYVVVGAELLADQGGKNPYVKLTAENMGQTPVYDLVFAASNSILDGYESISDTAKVMLTFDCSGPYAPALIKSQGHTFSKSHFSGMSISERMNSIDSVNDAFLKDQRIVAYGTVCYRDVFRQMHTIRLCYEWRSFNLKPWRCARQTEGEQED